MKDDYADIMNSERPVSRRHAPMPMEKRAAQFSPFAALSGYEDEVEEAVRIADAYSDTEFADFTEA